MNNKVKFNICNFHYALQKVAEDGKWSFETPVAMRVRFPWHWIRMGSRNLFMRMELSIISLPTIWAMMGIWNWH